MRRKRRLKLNDRVKIVKMEFTWLGGLHGKTGRIVGHGTTRKNGIQRYQVLLDDAEDPRFAYWFDADQVEKE